MSRHTQLIFLSGLGLTLLGWPGLPGGADIPSAPIAKYQLAWSQDFTRLSKLDVSAREIGKGTWIAHTPSSQDWFTFQDPGEPYHPFALGPDGLTIRVQKDGHDPNNGFGGFSGGLLSSMDGSGKGFAQQYGYFEASMQTPGGPNTWPAFWLLDAPTLTDKTLAEGAEIDATESYGNWGTGKRQQPPGNPNINQVAWHRWGHNGRPSTGGGTWVERPGMTAGFHTYGVDVEPDFITWYFDRKQIWQVPAFESARRPMFVLLNLALGGGTHNNADGSNYDWSLTPNPSDLKVKYVAVWASPNSPDYHGAPPAPTQVKAVAGKGKVMLSWAAGGTGCNIYRGSRPGGEGRVPIAAGVTGSSYLDAGLADGGGYYYKIQAVNRSDKSPLSAEVRVTPGAASAAGAEYLRTDTTTQGAWKGVYGADGHAVFGDATKYPAYAKASPSTEAVFKWPATTEARTLQKASDPAARIAAELHADSSLALDLDLTDGGPHEIALYFLDYDHKGEVNAVQIKDAVFGDLLATHTFASFAEGQYGVFRLKGHVQVVITNGAPRATNSQATLSGLFFGARELGRKGSR